MRELRAMGATNVLLARRRNRRCAEPRWRARSEIYAERFGLANGRVPATFEIITLTAWAPHESQQQPLRRERRCAWQMPWGPTEQPAGDTRRRPP